MSTSQVIEECMNIAVQLGMRSPQLIAGQNGSGWWAVVRESDGASMEVGADWSMPSPESNYSFDQAIDRLHGGLRTKVRERIANEEQRLDALRRMVP